MLKRVIIICFSLFVLGCSLESKDEKETGTITYIDLEGGFFGIVTDDGRNLDPINLDESFQINGQRIRFFYTEVHDLVGIHMWGTMVELADVESVQ